MGGGQTELSGPDLEQGIDFSQLEEGGILLGHAQGEPVLLARRGGEVFAIGALCTHYGVPLGEGLLVGDTVRCPAHHACFSLRTGEALRAPALNPVARWEVQRRGDTVYVTGRSEGAPGPSENSRGTAASGDGPPPTCIVVLGAGAAGSAAVETLRREGYTGRLVLIGAEESVPYDRPNLSKDYLAGNAPEEWIPLRPREFYAEQGIELALGVPASSIDVTRKRVVLADGSSYIFDALLIATGADPVRLPIPGGDLPHVHYLRTLADSQAIIATVGEARRAVVIGASFIGLEVAASLRTRGIEVHVVARGSRPLERVLGPEIGDFIRTLHEEHGVVFHLEQTAVRIDTDAVSLQGGKSLSADLVVIGAGVRPSVALAEEAGLVTDRGIVVDEYLETSVPGIFAAGDVARWPDPHSGEGIRIEHWVLAQRQGQTAARNMLDRRERFEAVPFFWSSHYDVTVAYVGHAQRWDRIDVSGNLDDRDCTLAFRALAPGGEERTLAIATVGRDRDSLRAEAAMERHDWAALESMVAPGGKIQHA